MPLFFMHLLFGGAFLMVWSFIAAMLFRDKLTEIRHLRGERSHDTLAAPHYLTRGKDAHTRVSPAYARDHRSPAA